MTNTLGGGGSLRHLLEHIGKAAEVWNEDMKKHAFELTPENINILDASVQKWTKETDMKSLEAERDDMLMTLIAAKDTSSYFK
jgi:3-hydroxyacyl-CoA dehydrogenase